MKRVIVGVTGPSGSGKTTFANRLCAKHGFTHYSFASPLKDLCAQEFGWDRDALDYDEAARAIGFETSLAYKNAIDPEIGKTRREVLQHIGTEGFRHVDHDFWVKKAARTLHQMCGNVVISDARFFNEFRAIQCALKGVLVMMLPPSGGAADTSGYSAHSSEQDWVSSMPDFRFQPKHGIPHVYACADSLVHELHRSGRIW